jgi:UPF0271 protein
MHASKIDLNCDLGESYGRYTMGEDEEILKLISSANVACGFHAGDSHVMRKTVSLAKQNNVKVGAHPGLPDLAGFGRRKMFISASELKDICTYQLGALNAFVRAAGMKMQHIIQHGALTSMAENDKSLGRAIIESILEVDPDLIYVCLPGSYIPEMARDMGLKVAMTAFADRAYDKNLRLVNRKIPGAVVHDISLVTERIERLLTEGTVKTLDGDTVELPFDSIMLHGDSPGSLELARAVKQAVQNLGVEVAPMSEIL